MDWLCLRQLASGGQEILGRVCYSNSEGYGVRGESLSGV